MTRSTRLTLLVLAILAVAAVLLVAARSFTMVDISSAPPAYE